MVKKDDKGSTDLREELRKEEVKERFTNIAFDLFSKGSDDETVMREISVFIPNVDINLIQRLRSQWQSKQDVDKEVAAIDRGEKPEKIEKPEHVELRPTPTDIGKEKPEQATEIKPSVEPPAEQPVKPPVTEEKTEDLLDAVERDAMHEKVVKKVEEKPVEEETTPETPTEPSNAEGKTIEKSPTPSLRDEVEAERSRAEIVRATEELRRAITSEIRAQESYEHARLELANAKRELDIVRGELDEFKHDVDMLKLKERVVEREPIEQPKLMSETDEGKRLEEKVSKKPFERIVEEIVEQKIKERELKEAHVEKEPVPVVPVGKEEVVEPTSKVDKEIQDESDKAEKKQKELDTEATEQTVAAKSFYERLLKHLSRHKYLVVRMGDEEPEVFKQNLTLRGAIIGAAAGVPAGCLVLYLILLLAGML